MEREVKFALIVGGSMVLGAIAFAVKTHHEVIAARASMAPPAPVNRVSNELDSLAQATEAPPPPAPDYSPTWISADQAAADSSVRKGSEATLSDDVHTEDRAPAGGQGQEEPKPARPSVSAYAPPAAEPTAEPAPPSNASQSDVTPNPSNNTELRQYIRRGK